MFLLKIDQYFYGFIQIVVPFTLLVEVLKEQSASSNPGSVERTDFCNNTKNNSYISTAIFASSWNARSSSTLFWNEGLLNVCCSFWYSCENVSIMILSFSLVSTFLGSFLSLFNIICLISISGFPLTPSLHFCVMLFKFFWFPNKTTLRYVVHLAMHSTR